MRIHNPGQALCRRGYTRAQEESSEFPVADRAGETAGKIG